MILECPRQVLTDVLGVGIANILSLSHQDEPWILILILILTFYPFLACVFFPEPAATALPQLYSLGLMYKAFLPMIMNKYSIYIC